MHVGDYVYLGADNLNNEYGIVQKESYYVKDKKLYCCLVRGTKKLGSQTIASAIWTN
jgi:hypothetical protein